MTPSGVVGFGLVQPCGPSFRTETLPPPTPAFVRASLLGQVLPPVIWICLRVAPLSLLNRRGDGGPGPRSRRGQSRAAQKQPPGAGVCVALGYFSVRTVHPCIKWSASS